MNESSEDGQHKKYEPIRGKKRKLSRFLAEELLYDYVTDNLDEHRASSVKEFVDSNVETQSELESLKQGIAFCEKISETEISPELQYKLSQVRSVVSRVLRVIHWRNWPEVTKWTLEAFVISLVVAFVAAVGWPNLVKMLPKPSPELTLAKIDKDSSLQDPRSDSNSEAQHLSSDEKDRDVVAEIAKVDQDETRSSEQKIVAADGSKAQPDVETDASQKAEIKPSAEKKNVAVKLAGQDDLSATESAKVKSIKKKVKPTLKGYVYRAYMELSEIDVVTDKIRSEIEGLGGSKAGKVQLGWKRPKGSYFHFRILEKHYDTIVSKLGNFGPVRIFKDPHWRVMPEGEIRFILEVEDKDLKSKKKQAKSSATEANTNDAAPAENSKTRAAEAEEEVSEDISAKPESPNETPSEVPAGSQPESGD